MESSVIKYHIVFHFRTRFELIQKSIQLVLVALIAKNEQLICGLGGGGLTQCKLNNIYSETNKHISAQCGKQFVV